MLGIQGIAGTNNGINDQRGRRDILARMGRLPLVARFVDPRPVGLDRTSPTQNVEEPLDPRGAGKVR